MTSNNSNDDSRSSSTATPNQHLDDEELEITILSPPRRRYILYCLFDLVTPVALPHIAEQVAIWEGHADSDAFLEKRLDIYYSLHSEHLPALEDGNIVSYDPETEFVELGPMAELVRSIIYQEFHADIDCLLEAEQYAFENIDRENEEP